MTRALNIGSVPATVRGYPTWLLDLPFRDRLVGAYLFGDGVAGAAKNWGSGADGIIVGSPGAGAGFLTFGESWLQTPIMQTLQMTLSVVARRPTGTEGNVGMIGDYVANTAGNDGLALWAAANVVARVPRAGAVNAFGGLGWPGWRGFALSTPLAGPDLLRSTFPGSNASGAGSGNRVIQGQGPLRIGRLYAPTITAPVALNSALIFDTALTAAQADAVLALQRAYAEACGLNMET